MGRYGGRSARADKGSSNGSGRSRGSSRGRSNSRSSRNNNNNSEFVSLGDLAGPKSKADDKDFQEITDELMDMENSYSAKVYLGPETEQITIKKGDRIMVKFKEYESSPDYVVGKVFLVIDED